MTNSLHYRPTDEYPTRRSGVRTAPLIATFTLAVAALSGCGHETATATVSGTLQCQGQPLDNCLVTFLPEAGSDAGTRRSTGLTDARGVYQLRFDDLQEGATVGWHRVTVQDLSVSIGVRRRDNGTVDAEIDAGSEPPPEVRALRVPENYAAVKSTPLRKEVQLGHQVVDLEIE